MLSVPFEVQAQADQGFHAGELAVQRRAGVAAQAARLQGMLAPAELRDGLVRFLHDRTFAALTAHDHDQRLWVSPLSGPPGFLAVTDPTTLAVHAVPRPGDPLHAVRPGQAVGLLVIEFATRRRVRINGILVAADDDGLRIEVDQAYGNCPQYIQQRVLTAASVTDANPEVRRGDHLDSSDIDLIRGADTFMIGTRHPDRGADSSHRGGPPGFVRVQDNTHLWWPDYAGNNMFNTLGNLAVDPSAAALFPDFVTGRTVQVSGQARLEWITPGAPGDDDATGRRVHLSITDVVSGRLLPVRSGIAHRYEHNPAVMASIPNKNASTE
jgi:predicted pyridoxine 5'-phosphate oxidase superfamily flavin-nucleotide-binding protein